MGLMIDKSARALIECFAEQQQGGHFAGPCCGKMAMDAESVTRNALSRRATVYICDACGMQEALEDMMDSRTPLNAWAIAQMPENWRMGAPKLRLEYRGRDSWDRPVYECDGRLYVDVDPRRSRPADICTKQGNAFNGEPCDPVPEGTIIEFVPERDTWPF